MTDKQLIETFRNIIEECKKHDVCKGCILEKAIEFNNCQLMALLDLLDEDAPHNWNMNEIERIVKYE